MIQGSDYKGIIARAGKADSRWQSNLEIINRKKLLLQVRGTGEEGDVTRAEGLGQPNGNWNPGGDAAPARAATPNRDGG